MREIEGGLLSHRTRLYHVRAKPVKRSTLADANALRPAAVFAGLFLKLMKQAHRGLRRSLEETVYLIDSTSLRLNELSKEWARFSSGVCGAKAHIIYDADAACPVYMAVTAANVNDITAAQAMPIEAGDSYVFDLGYYDYGWWARLDAAGCRIVTRFKSNTPLRRIEDRPIIEGGAILSDRVGYLPARQAKNRSNPYRDPVREVRVTIETGKSYASSPTISTPAPKRLRRFTSAAGRLSCSSVGSNKISRSRRSSGHLRTLSAFRSRSLSSPTCSSSSAWNAKNSHELAFFYSVGESEPDASKTDRSITGR